VASYESQGTIDAALFPLGHTHDALDDYDYSRIHLVAIAISYVIRVLKNRLCNPNESIVFSSFVARPTPNLSDMTVQQIREQAMREVPVLIKGFSPNSSLSSAKKLGETALAQEGSGNAKLALYQYSMVAASVFSR
jgi:hypothetical protein